MRSLLTRVYEVLNRRSIFRMRWQCNASIQKCLDAPFSDDIASDTEHRFIAYPDIGSACSADYRYTMPDNMSQMQKKKKKKKEGYVSLF